jgi:hypothetical protein
MKIETGHFISNGKIENKDITNSRLAFTNNE